MHTNTWDTWVVSNLTSASTTSIWCDWVTFSATSTATIWTSWVNDQAQTNPPQWVMGYTPVRRIATQERRKREEAEHRAELLLIANLSLEQRLEYEQHKAFTVHGRDARYRIRKGRMGNVDVVNKDGIIVHRLCAHPGVYVPDFDTMLAQKLALECAEEQFVNVANRHAPFSASQRVLEAMH